QHRGEVRRHRERRERGQHQQQTDPPPPQARLPTSPHRPSPRAALAGAGGATTARRHHASAGPADSRSISLMISGPSIVTSPAPIVSTKSPDSTSRATSDGTSVNDGS